MPAAGRPAVFLGGVGRFAVQAEVSAKVVRVGQEFDFRVTVSGPAAWGMTELPELTRYDRVPLGVADQARANRAQGRAAPAHLYLPPQALAGRRSGAAADLDRVVRPVSVTLYDSGDSECAIRVVAVSAFDPATIDDGTTSVHAGRFGRGAMDRLESLGDRIGRSSRVAHHRAEASAPRLAGAVCGPAICRTVWLEASRPMIFWPGSQARAR